jgi:O-antigen ligase
VRAIAARRGGLSSQTLSDGALAAGAGLMLGAVALSAAVVPSRTTYLLMVVAAAPFVAMIVGDVRRLLLVAVVLDVALLWDVNLGYNDAAARLGALGGLDVSVTTISLAGLYAIWLGRRAAVFDDSPRAALRSARPLFAYIAVCIASVAVARDRTLAGYEVALLLQTCLLFIYVVSTTRTRQDVGFLATALVACLLVESVLLIGLRVTGANFGVLGISSSNNLAAVAGNTRLAGTMGSPNTAGSFLAMLLPLAIAMLATPVSARVRRLCVAAIPLGMAALVITGSRGAWISFAIASVILAVFAAREGLISPRRLVAAGLGILVILAPFTGAILQRASGSDNGSAESRVGMTRLASDMISDHPLLGVGLNNMAENIPDYAGPQYAGQFIFTVHNKYLLVWTEAGIAALLAFLWFLAATLRRGWFAVRAGDELLSPLALGLSAALAGQLVHMAVDIFENRSQVQLLWLVAALLAAMAAVLARERAAPAPQT